MTEAVFLFTNSALLLQSKKRRKKERKKCLMQVTSVCLLLTALAAFGESKLLLGIKYAVPESIIPYSPTEGIGISCEVGVPQDHEAFKEMYQA